MKTAMLAFCGGDTMDSVWTGLTDYNMERTYIMAKNIVETNRVKDEFAYYNIGTNIITYTYGRHGKEYMLMDLQRVKLKEALKDKDDKWIKYDTDGDGLYDRDELGKDGETFEYYDVTKFIEKMVLSELYGSHYKKVNSIPSERKEGVTYLTNDDVNSIMTNFKKNLIRRRKDDSASDESKSSFMSRANTVDAKEQAEYYLNCFKKEDTNGSLYATEADAEIAKIKVELYAFDSNPIFKDTDFDGVPDGKGYQELQRLGNEYGRDTHTGRVMYNNLNEYMKVDLEPQNNKVSGKMITTGDKVGKTLWGFGEEANTHMDYRYFFMDNKNYYDELSTMSLMLCNTLEHNENSGSGDLANLTTLFRRIGLKKWNDESEVEIKVAKFGTNGEVKYVVGENEIEYTHNYTEKTISKKVKLIVVKSIDAGKDNIEKIGSDRNNINQHELFEGLAKAIYTNEFKGQDYCYWVTGYNTGGAVANVLAAKMIDNGLYYVPKGGIGTSSNAYITYDNGQKSTQSKHWQVISNVYCYTFGAPYTVYNGGEITEEENTISSKYASIFNVVSNGDIYGFILPNDFKWGRYGVTCYKVHEEHKKISNESEIDKQQTLKEMRINLVNLIRDVFNIYENNNMFKDNYYSRDYESTQETSIKEILKYFLQNQNIPTSVTNDIRNNATLKSRYIVLINFLNRQRKFINEGRDEKIYYELSKKILPEDINFIVNTENNRTREIVKVKDMNEEVLLAIKDAGEWYCDNIASYWYYRVNDLDDDTYKKQDISNNPMRKAALRNDQYNRGNENAKNRFDRYAENQEYITRNEEDQKQYVMHSGEGNYKEMFYHNNEATDLYIRGGYSGYFNENNQPYNNGRAYNVGNDNYNKYPYLVGDDCSDFAMAVILNVSKGNRGQSTPSNAARASERGLKLHNTSSYTFRTDDNCKSAMEQLGYTRYDSKDLEELIPGDLLCCSGHVEFYYGYRYKVDLRTGATTDELERVPVSNGHYTSTFGWGKVFPSFPNSDSYFYKSGNIFKKNGDSREYDIVYRRETDELNIKAIREMNNE